MVIMKGYYYYYYYYYATVWWVITQHNSCYCSWSCFREALLYLSQSWTLIKQFWQTNYMMLWQRTAAVTKDDADWFNSHRDTITRSRNVTVLIRWDLFVKATSARIRSTMLRSFQSRDLKVCTPPTIRFQTGSNCDVISVSCRAYLSRDSRLTQRYW